MPVIAFDIRNIRKQKECGWIRRVGCNNVTAVSKVSDRIIAEHRNVLRATLIVFLSGIGGLGWFAFIRL